MIRIRLRSEDDHGISSRRRYIIHYPRRMLAVRYGVGLSYARPGGGPILKEDKSLRHVNGIWINWPTGSLWLLFRRPSY